MRTERRRERQGYAVRANSGTLGEATVAWLIDRDIHDVTDSTGSLSQQE
jgi:hypothetical protein